MRLQLDSAVAGAGITRSGESGQTAPVGGGTDSRLVGTEALWSQAGGTDSIRLSGLSSALSSLSTDRAARVQQLTALVQDGSYQVPSTQVGRAIVNDAVAES